LILRNNYYRLLGPVVEEALRRRLAVECWHDWSAPRRGGKASEFPDATPSFRSGTPVVRRYHGAADLAQQWRHDPPDVVLSIDPPDPDVRAASKARWLWLQYGADVLFQRTPAGVRDADAILLYSEYWSQRIEQRFPDSGVAAELGDKAIVVGAPELDAVQGIDKEEVRRRFGLPPDRAIVLYLPFPLRSNISTPWLRNIHAPRTRWSQAFRTLLARRWQDWPYVVGGW